MTISQRIFEVLKEKDIKQKELSKNANISEAAISDWKKKGTNPTAEKLSAIAETLGVSLDYLLTGENKIASLSNEERALLDSFNRLSERGKRQVIERIKVIEESEKETPK